MDTSKIEKLRIAANQFYLNKYMDQPTMSDIEYDQLANEYETEGGSVKDLVEWDPDLRRPNQPLPKVGKTQVTDNNLGKAAMSYINQVKDGEKFSFYFTYKYDGSSIIAYYTPEGRLKCILGTPDQELCMDRTKNCWNLFPHQIQPGIECIQGEFLVDATKYGQLARNKANGLLNSKDMIDEIETEGYIRIYQMRFYDGLWSIERLAKELMNLPCIVRKRNGYKDLVFSDAEGFVNLFPVESIITEKYRFEGVYRPLFQIDGVVAYHEYGYHALKFYYTESAVTTVTKVVWTLQNNGGYSCKLWFEPVVLNGKTIGQVTSGGVPNLMDMGMGKGAKIRVILANMTIPKVIEVLEPSEDYEWPVCECGYQMSEKDIFGSTLKCQAEVCTTKYNLWKPRIEGLVTNSKEDTLQNIVDNKFDVLNKLLNIDRWEAKSACKLANKFSLEFDNEIKEVLLNGSLEDFRDLIRTNFYMSDLAASLFYINSGTAFKILCDIIR